MDLEETFIEIMKSKDDKIIAVLGKYLHYSMIKRCGANPNPPPNHNTENAERKNKP